MDSLNELSGIAAKNMGNKDDDSVPLIQGIAAKVKNIEGVIKSQHPTLQSRVNELRLGSPKSATRVTFEPKLWIADFSTNVAATRVTETFASKVAGIQEKKQVNFRFLEGENSTDADVTIPVASVKSVQERFNNVLFGYFLGKRLAFPVVQYFVNNRWKKHGLQKSMMNSKGFFFFKFNSKEGMEQVLKEGPWLIRNVPMFVKIWTPTTELKKEELKKVPVWVKIHDVPIAAYTEDGLSIIASKLGAPKMLDAETANMCLDPWGKGNFARAVIELDAGKEVQESLSIAVPNLEDGGYCKTTVTVEYEWKPARCSKCCIFGHSLDTCPDQPKGPVLEPLKSAENGTVDEEGFIMGNTRKKHGQQGNPQNRQPKNHGNSGPSTSSGKPGFQGNSGNSKSGGNIGLKNSFGALGDGDEDLGFVGDGPTKGDQKKNKGASTPKKAGH